MSRAGANATWKRSFIVCGVALVLTAVVLMAMGRLAVCKCGVVALWSGDIASNQNSQQFADPYTFTHILHGTLFYLLLWMAGRRYPVAVRFAAAVVLEGGWEVIENTDYVIQRYREATISLDYYGDSILNSMGDVAAMAAGFLLAWRLPVRASVAGSILLDILLVLWIRDSLAINILMLIYPVEVVKDWQLRR